MVARRPCCTSGRCSDPGIVGMMPTKTVRYSGDAAMDWTDRSDCGWSAFPARKRGRRPKAPAGWKKADPAGNT